LCAVGGIGDTTSGVERLFGAGQRACGISRQDLCDGIINDELTLICDVDPNEDQELIDTARTLWALIYPPVRSSDRNERMDKGRKRERTYVDSDEKLSLTGWEKRRRVQVAEIAKDLQIEVGAQLPDKAVGVDMWTADHEKEQNFQRDKQLIKFLEAANEGLLLPEEMTPGVKEALVIFNKAEGIKRATYLRDKERLRAVQKGPSRVMIDGRKVFVESKMSEPKDFSKILKKNGLTKVGERKAADVFIVADVANPGQRIAENPFDIR
jgi:hypothetical protein